MRDSFLLACYKGFFARIFHEDGKWIGRVLDMEDLLVFDGKTIEEALETFHAGIEGYIIAAGGTIKPHAKTQIINMIRFGIENPDFDEEAKKFLEEFDE